MQFPPGFTGVRLRSQDPPPAMAAFVAPDAPTYTPRSPAATLFQTDRVGSASALDAPPLGYVPVSRGQPQPAAVYSSPSLLAASADMPLMPDSRSPPPATMLAPHSSGPPMLSPQIVYGLSAQELPGGSVSPRSVAPSATIQSAPTEVGGAPDSQPLESLQSPAQNTRSGLQEFGVQKEQPGQAMWDSVEPEDSDYLQELDEADDVWNEMRRVAQNWKVPAAKIRETALARLSEEARRIYENSGPSGHLQDTWKPDEDARNDEEESIIHMEAFSRMSAQAQQKYLMNSQAVALDLPVPYSRSPPPLTGSCPPPQWSPHHSFPADLIVSADRDALPHAQSKLLSPQTSSADGGGPSSPRSPLTQRVQPYSVHDTGRPLHDATDMGALYPRGSRELAWTQPVDALAHERTMDMSAHLRGGHPSLAWSGVLDFGGVAPSGSHLSPAKEDKAAIERKNLEIQQRQKARQALEKQINEHLSEALAQLHEIEKKDLIEYKEWVETQAPADQRAQNAAARAQRLLDEETLADYERVRAENNRLRQETAELNRLRDENLELRHSMPPLEVKKMLNAERVEKERLSAENSMLRGLMPNIMTPVDARSAALNHLEAKELVLLREENQQLRTSITSPEPTVNGSPLNVSGMSPPPQLAAGISQSVRRAEIEMHGSRDKKDELARAHFAMSRGPDRLGDHLRVAQQIGRVPPIVSPSTSALPAKDLQSQSLRRSADEVAREHFAAQAANDRRVSSSPRRLDSIVSRDSQSPNLTTMTSDLPTSVAPESVVSRDVLAPSSQGHASQVEQLPSMSPPNQELNQVQDDQNQTQQQLAAIYARQKVSRSSVKVESNSMSPEDVQFHDENIW